MCRSERIFSFIAELFISEGHHQNAVRRCHPDAHNRTHQSRYTDWSASNKKYSDNPGKCAGKCHDDDKRIQPALKINRHQKVNQQNGKSYAHREPETEPDRRAIHTLSLASDHHRCTAWEMWLHIIHDFLNLLSDRSQIAVLDISINVKDRLDVVMTDDDRSRDVLDRSQITKKLGLRATTARESRYWRLISQITEGGWRTISTCDRRQINVRSRADQVLGGLDHDGVADPVLRVQPEVRSRLSAAG